MRNIPGTPHDPPMAFNIFGGGGGSQKTSNNQSEQSQGQSTSRGVSDQASGGYSQVNLPPWLEAFNRENIDLLRDVTSREYESYEGQRVADFTPDHTAGFDLTRGNVGAYQPYLDSAGNTVQGVQDRTTTPWTEADIAGYMNPYIQQVMDRALSETNRQSDITRTNIKGDMASQGAFGGSAQGIELGEHERNTQDLRQNLIASLLNQGYNDAGQRFQFDESNRLASDTLRLGAGQTQAVLGEAASRLGYGDAAALLDIGERQKQQEQAKLDVAYDDFLRQFAYPIDMLNLRLSGAASVPYGATTINEQIGRGVDNQFAGNSGSASGSGSQKTSAGSGGGASSTLGSFASLAGTIAPIALAAFSSKEFKEDVRDADTILEGVKGLPVKAWRYKPEMGLGTETHVGPFAEDWRDTFGLGDGRTINMLDMHGISLAAIKELAEQVEQLET